MIKVTFSDGLSLEVASPVLEKIPRFASLRHFKEHAGFEMLIPSDIGQVYFEAVAIEDPRERLDYLRSHPEILEQLPDVLEYYPAPLLTQSMRLLQASINDFDAEWLATETDPAVLDLFGGMGNHDLRQAFLIHHFGDRPLEVSHLLRPSIEIFYRPWPFVPQVPVEMLYLDLTGYHEETKPKIGQIDTLDVAFEGEIEFVGPIRDLRIHAHHLPQPACLKPLRESLEALSLDLGEEPLDLSIVPGLRELKVDADESTFLASLESLVFPEHLEALDFGETVIRDRSGKLQALMSKLTGVVRLRGLDDNTPFRRLMTTNPLTHLEFKAEDAVDLRLLPASLASLRLEGPTLGSPNHLTNLTDLEIGKVEGVLALPNLKHLETLGSNRLGLCPELEDLKLESPGDRTLSVELPKVMNLEVSGYLAENRGKYLRFLPNLEAVTFRQVLGLDFFPKTSAVSMTFIEASGEFSWLRRSNVTHLVCLHSGLRAKDLPLSLEVLMVQKSPLLERELETAALPKLVLLGTGMVFEREGLRVIRTF